MDTSDSGQGQEKPPETPDSTPSSKGRQRKKNPKYLDFETDKLLDEQNKTDRRSSEGGASKRSPVKRQKPENDTQEASDGKNEATSETPKESDGVKAKKTPKKAARAKKTPTKRTPGRKTPSKKTTTTKGALPNLEGGVADSAQQENGTPKPKRKYVKKQRIQVEETVTEAPPSEEAPEEITPGGRPRRGAAKAALKYLHTLVKEVLNHPGDEAASKPGDDSDGADTDTEPKGEGKGPRGRKGRKGRKRKRADSDAAEDEDFVPDADEMEAEEVEDEDNDDEEEAEFSDSELWLNEKSLETLKAKRSNSYKKYGKMSPNGLNDLMMIPVWDSVKTTKKFREEHCSRWVFPEWIPSTSDWSPVPQSDLEKYLPQELQSAAIKLSREGLKNEELPPQRLSRFTALPAHPDRWDMLLYAGGPVWALEWCPTPDGAPASQFIALACHRGMDDKHQANKTYIEHGLVQLWDLGRMECNSRPDATPALSYGLALDKGFIWHLKWCPAGGWEPPNSDRKAPSLPRLGLLAVATSNSTVTIYSLPHPEALLSYKKSSNCGKDGQQLPIYQVKGVITLKLGSFRAPRQEKSGQILSMDWLHVKPHNIMAVGFYDGVVGLWDLSTKSGLLRVRESGMSLSLLPYQCFVAHDHAVKDLAFCPASKYLIVTAGEDRLVKLWDLRRLHDPVTVQKRYLINEICWPLNAPGFLWAQDNAYAPSGNHGVHYFDHMMRTIFAIPRIGTIWSISYSDWLNSLVTGDRFGEVIFTLFPLMSYTQIYVKRSKDRRFPVYLTSMVPFDSANEGNQGVRGGSEEEEGNAVEQQEEEATEGENENNENTQEGGRAKKDKNPPLQSHLYQEVAKKYFIHHTDSNMLTFVGIERRPVWKRMCDTEGKLKLNLDEMPLATLHKVRFNPNMLSHTWLATGGQTGLVRLINLRGMIGSESKKLMSESRAHFSKLYSRNEQDEPVQTVTEEL
ncbi:general transcription factor 3C polypeptide 2 [Cheilinus undulatus]|uniref:general transcription factor 3C polypeptide 2 n=1 Tax=Cheilinus undulatus TaxID=241271 RepID=UPI001BD6DCFD|nr:general transcription factor 3C polypeptide 2 [Cheilinus undulatus]XP_041661494.1 general transcription factor 3C polypeptide 2 [Cheilinus undulatus]XP_041661495.1 general transcription factor 3C polypeptide 2 [Cheilinus undulatus]